MTFSDLIGMTPLVRLEQIPAADGVAPGVRLLAKLEGNNPGGSVKDRAAWEMLHSALDREEIQPGDALVEATSGNTGIALAMVSGRLNLHLTLVVPRSATSERVQAMRAFGAEVIHTGEGEGMEEARRLAQTLARERRLLQLNQFANPDNWRAHFRTTGPEVWSDTDGQVTHFVSAMGTTGTIMGASRYLKQQNPGVRIVGVHPADGARIPGIRRWSPEMTPPIYEAGRVDRIELVTEEEAVAATRRLAREEGILAGTSSGGALAAALRVARGLKTGTVVFIVCDRGDRYLSSPLFA